MGNKIKLKLKKTNRRIRQSRNNRNIIKRSVIRPYYTI